jgi:gliding motility-associated-like protein
LPINAIPISTPVTCNGYSNGSINLTISGGTPAYSFEWSNNQTTQNLNNANSGNYWVTITDNNGCTAVASEVVFEPNPIITSISTTSVHCNGNSDGSAIANVQGGVTPYTYEWSDNYTGSNHSGISAGIYTLTITDANNCNDILSIQITEPVALTLSYSVTNAECYGSSTGSINISTTGGTSPYSYLWNNLSVSEDISNITAGNYTVTITDNNDCTFNQNFTINQPNKLESSSSITNGFCSNQNIGEIAITVIGGTPQYQYLWSNGATSASLNSLAPNTYFVTISDQNSCTLIDTAIVSGSPSVSVSTTYLITLGQIHSEITGGTAPFAYSWNNGSTDSLVQNIETGHYAVTVSDDFGCTATSSIDVLVEFIIPSVFTPNDDNINDNWEIKGIEAYNEVSIEIFNRWGDLMFKFNGSGLEYKNKANQWNGKNNGKELPVSTYVYIVNLHDNNEPINGTVSIVR